MVQPTQGGLVALTLVLALSAFSYRYIEFGRVADWRRLFLWPHVSIKQGQGAAPTPSRGQALDPQKG